MDSRTPPLFDRAQVLEALGGDEDLFRQIALAFIAEWPAREKSLRRALDAGAAEPLCRAAHAVKGAVGNFSAQQALEAARTLEVSCRNGDLANAAPQVDALLDSVGALLAALRAELRQA